MKNILTLWVLLSTLLLSNQSIAQCEAGGPTLSFSDAQPCTGEDFCIDVSVEDFTDLTALKVPIVWDTSVMELISINDLNLTRLTMDDFDMSQAAEGLIKLDWFYEDCNLATSAVTLADDVVIFRLCFQAKAGYGATTTVDVTDDNELTNDPEPIIVRRLGVCASNIGLCSEPAYVTTCVVPVELYATSTTGNPGELVSVDVKTRGFRNLNSMQFTVSWDTAVIAFEDVIPLENLVNLNIGQFGTPDAANVGPGNLTMSWSFIDAAQPGTDLADDLSIFTINFRIKGECETSTAIRFTDSPTTIEAINTREENGEEILSEVPFILTEGEVSVGACTPEGLLLYADCGPSKNVNEEVCIQVTASELMDVRNIKYLMEWNPNILRYTGVRSLNTTSIPGLSQTDFNADNVSNGILELDWSAASSAFNANINEGDLLYEVCFDVVGFGGNSPFRFDPLNAFVRQEGNIFNVGIFPSNCEVSVNQPPGLNLSLSTEQAPPGDTVCVDVTASNFNDLLNAQFSLSWDPNHVKFSRVSNLNPALSAKASINGSGSASGSLTFQWEDMVGLSLPDDAVLFSICLVVTGTPPGELFQTENCDPVSVVSFPLETQAISTTSNGVNLGITAVDGSVCVLNPEGFFLDVVDTEGVTGTTTCVPLKVVDFDDITSAQFAINWDPTSLDFVSISSPTIPTLTIPANIDTSSASVGVIGFDWNDPAGLSLPDSSVLLDVCFQLIGAAPDCIDIAITSDPNPSVTTINGAGSVFPLEGSLCIKDSLFILGANITPATCPDVSDGRISLNVDAGGKTFFYNWRSLVDGTVRLSPEVTNFPVGEVEVTIFTIEAPFLSTTDTFYIPLTEVLPVSDAGADKTLGCELGAIILTGTGSPAGDYNYEWRTVGGEIGGSPASSTIVARRPGDYIFVVTDAVTGCAARDTAVVLSPEIPIADAGRTQYLICTDTEKVLDGSGSSPLDSNTTYLWTAFSGGLIEMGDDSNTVMPRVLGPGVYALQVTFEDTGCSASDTVEVVSLEEYTPVSAGPDQELNCDTLGITLFSTVNNAMRDFEIEWFDASGNSLAIDDRINVNMPGTYIVQATDLDNLCATTDTIQVLPNNAQPVIDLADSAVIDCRTPVLTLQTTVSNSNNYTVVWESANGGMLVENPDAPLNPSFITAGTYTLTVTDTTNSCVTTDFVIVEDKIQDISVEAGAAVELTCETPAVTLRGTVDNDLSLSWTLNGSEVGTTDTLLVTTAGTYYLTALNAETGCTNQDSVVVTSSADLPEISILDLPMINCTDATVTVSAAVQPAADYTITWTSLDGGMITAGANTLSPIMAGTGNYQIEAFNPLTGCRASQQITVEADTLRPTANAGDDITLTCAQSQVTLSGLGSSEGENIVYEWSAVEAGAMPSPADALQTSVTAAGTYQLQVRNTQNGCVATDVVTVVPDTALPQVQIAQAEILTCTVDMVQLDGTGSDQDANLIAAWSALDGQANPVVGNDPFMATATAAGVYQLTLINQETGCQASSTITVSEDRTAPVADAGADVFLTCPGTSTATLDGTGSSQGSLFTYQWTSLDGQDVMNATSLSPSVSQPTSLELVVTNTSNGCSASASVSALIDPALAVADAGADDTSCGADAAIFATSSPGTTGQWTTTGTAVIDLPGGVSTTVSNLQLGENVFIWTLSTANCPNYSSDSITILREQAPVATPDAVALEVGDREVAINVQANDIVTAPSGATVKIVTPPTLGVVADSVTTNGVLTYRVPGGVNGEDSFVYEICNSECVEFCDQALVSVLVPFDPNYTPTLVNGITPNGDGKNDALIFESLEIDPEAFPDNHLIIFNRWGDIVFEARPYNNDWQGTNMAGQELPQGTYYYILRLDISEGNILKGDITVVK